MKSIEDRRVLLTEAAIAIGAEWAKILCEDIRRDGRTVSGGWPGTLSEARARVTASLDLELARRRMGQLTDGEAGWATRAAYQKAKRDWLAMP